MIDLEQINVVLTFSNSFKSKSVITKHCQLFSSCDIDMNLRNVTDLNTMKLYW